MGRITDFRVVELRIRADKFPLPERVDEMLRLYAGPGQWEGNEAVFELPIYRVEEIERAFVEAGGSA
jgi:hypothetical protein